MLILLVHQSINVFVNFDCSLVESRPIKVPPFIGGFVDFDHVQFQIPLHNFG